MSARSIIASTVFWTLRVIGFAVAACLFVVVALAVIAILFDTDSIFDVLRVAAVAFVAGVVVVILVIAYEWAKEARNECNGPKTLE